MPLSVRLGLDHDSVVLQLPDGRDIAIPNTAAGMDLLVRYVAWDDKAQARPQAASWTPSESYVPSAWVRAGGMGEGKVPAGEPRPRRYTTTGRPDLTLADLGLD